MPASILDVELNPEFVDAVFVEMTGAQMLAEQLMGKENSGIQYKLGEDRSTVILTKCKFTDRAVQFVTKRLDSGAPKHEKLAAILYMVVGSIKFGMYLQRKVNSRNGIIQ